MLGACFITPQANASVASKAHWLHLAHLHHKLFFINGARTRHAPIQETRSNAAKLNVSKAPYTFLGLSIPPVLFTPLLIVALAVAGRKTLVPIFQKETVSATQIAAELIEHPPVARATKARVVVDTHTRIWIGVEPCLLQLLNRQVFFAGSFQCPLWKSDFQQFLERSCTGIHLAGCPKTQKIHQ